MANCEGRGEVITPQTDGQSPWFRWRVRNEGLKPFANLAPPLPPRTAVDTADGLSFIPGPDVGGGVGLVRQAHGGALRTGGNPGNRGGRVTAERHRPRAERSEAVDDAMVG